MGVVGAAHQAEEEREGGNEVINGGGERRVKVQGDAVAAAAGVWRGEGGARGKAAGSNEEEGVRGGKRVG